MLTPNRLSRAALVISFSLSILVAAASPAWATGNIVKSDLKGTWRISLHGLTADCGFATALATITFGTTGIGTGPLQLHGTTCGTSTLASQTMTVNTLAKNGEGTATLTCGGGCQWPFTIQVSPDRAKFNLVDVTIGSDYVEGVAILSSPADHIALADLKGDWTLMLMGHQLDGCDTGTETLTASALGTVSLNTAGAGAMDVTVHTTAGDFADVDLFVITSLNPDGSGTARAECDEDSGFTFGIQVSPDRSMFNLVTVSPSEPGVFLAGTAIRRSTAGHITATNLAGPWQGTIFAQDVNDDVGAVLLTFKLNAKAASKKVSFLLHGTEGDGDLIETAFTVETLNPDGSGTACFSFEAPCDFRLRIQVSPDRAIVSVVVVDPANEDFLTGLLIAQ